MVQVTELGYMGIGVRDLDEWKNFAANIVGMEVLDEGDRDRCYLRMDYHHHRLIVDRDGSVKLVVSLGGAQVIDGGGQCHDDCRAGC